MITPFRVDVPQADLDDLADRLARTRWPDELPDAGDDYGYPMARLRDLVEYWRTGYDWRAHEAELNTHPQFVTGIDGQRVHFLHVRSTNPDALALILTHGWPGSIVEFLDVIEPLRADFHLVIPSIPGFGFSGPTRERGWDVDRVARAWATLMRELGYERYGAQGGDWGAAISRALGVVAPDNVIGVHLNYLPTPPPPGVDIVLGADDAERLAGIRHYLANQPGYRVVQSTRPQTVAYALTDSPVGQLAWMAEWFDAWRDPRAEIDRDRLLTDVMLYWLNASSGSAARLHRETGRAAHVCAQPTGVAVFAHDITLAIRPFAEHTHNITHWSEFERGGHFPGLEVPDLLAADIKAFFATLR